MADSEHYSGGGEKTIAKNVILEKYLAAYLNIMHHNWEGQKWYVDTHAGTGFSNEYGVDIPGSALRALNEDFDRFYFYETNHNRFRILVNTIDEETEAAMNFGELTDTGVPLGWCNDPRIRVMNMDCNEGVRYLAEEGRDSAHWFTFVDPEKMSVERRLMEALCDRGKMDILFNFQTSAFVRNAHNAASHSHETVAQNLGENFPRNGSAEEYVEFYKENVFRELGWNAISRPMESEGDNDWRYDLIFATQNETADGIMEDIYDSDLRNDVADQIRTWRRESDVPQEGIDTYVRIPTEDQVTDDEQSCLTDF